jgi:hypothetical protein
MPNTIAPVFPFDPTGLALTNKVTNEQQILTSANGIDYHFLVPFAGPYFEGSLVVTIKDPVTNAVTTLTPGIDYYPSHWFISASRACASSIYGSVTFLDSTLSGIVSFTYQSIGGGWTINSAEVATILADYLHNPRITAWEEVVLSYQVVNAPSLVPNQLYLIAELGTTDFTLVGALSNAVGTQFKANAAGTGTGTAVSMSFPPTPHQWNITDMVGMSSVVSAINNVADSIIAAIPANLAISNSVTAVTALVNAESTRALAAENTLNALILSEASRASAEEAVLVSQLAVINISLGTSATGIAVALADEVTRATTAEAALANDIATEVTNRINAIAAEANRAIAAELALATAAMNFQAEDEAYFNRG